MSPRLAGFKFNISSRCCLASFFLILMMLTSCSGLAPETGTDGSVPTPSVGEQAGSHAPVILRVVDRQENIDGFLYVFQDIYFHDPDGDAEAVTYQELSSSLPYAIPMPDEILQPSAEAKKGELLSTIGGKCRQRMIWVVASRIRDRAGNLSQAVTFRMYCTAPPVVDTGAVLVGWLSIALPITLLLGLAFWLLFRKRAGKRLAVLRSLLLLALLITVVNFAGSILHEGGHALYVALHGIPILLYIHPFAFPGYARPFIDNSTWINIAGSLAVLALSLLLFLPFWRRRSTATLPLVLFFPVSAVWNGLNILGVGGSDFRNPVQYNGVSPIPFNILGTLFILVGILLLLALLPLLGLDPKDKKALFVLPGGMFLLNILSLPVALLVVPGSTIDRQYFLGQEILSAVSPVMLADTAIWLVIALLYVTLYRRLAPHLPAWLRTEIVQPSWKDLHLPAILAAVCVVLGVIIIL